MTHPDDANADEATSKEAKERLEDLDNNDDNESSVTFQEG